MTPKSRGCLLLALASVLIPGNVALADQFSATGWDDLFARLGPDLMPTGFGVVTGQVEAPLANSYAPDVDHAEFVGKNITLVSGNSGISGHATNMGKNMYGLTVSLSPEVNDIFCYEANHWLGSGFLRIGQGALPPLDAFPIKVFNNSWVGTANNNGVDNDILRRHDSAVAVQELLIMSGMNNGAGNIDFKLMSHAFNGMAVGRSDGNHKSGNTLAGIDGPGRMKPEIVAPRGTTSAATALMSAAAHLMVDTARNWNGLSQNTNAERSDVIKAALMAGALHRPAWDNQAIEGGSQRGLTVHPLDAKFGADVVNVNQSHFIMTGLEQDGSSEPPLSGTVPTAGWDLAAIGSGEDVYWRFEILEEKDKVSILTTWNRRVNANFTGYELPNLSLELFEIDEQGALSSIRGDAGLDAFDGGNVASLSPVDNVEHLFIKGLKPGSYVLELSRMGDQIEGDWEAAVAWYMPENGLTPADLVDFEILKGFLIAGGLADMMVSDDMVLQTRSQLGFTAFEPNVMEVVVGMTTDVDPQNFLQFMVETRINNPSGDAKIRMRNWTTGGLDQIGTHSLGLEEETHQFLNIEADDYVRSSDNRIEVNMKHVVVATFTAQGFDSFFDLVGVDVN